MDDTQDGSETRFERFRRGVRRTVETLRGSTISVRPFRPDGDGPLSTFERPTGHDVVEQYWVNAPFAYVVITDDLEENELRYHVVEPDLDPFEARLLERVTEDIRDPILFSTDVDAGAEATLRTELETLLEQYGVEIGMSTFYTLLYYLYRDFRGYDRVDALMKDPHIEDISCDGYNLPLFVYHETYTDIETDVVFDADELDTYVNRLAQQ
ncbi:MAG: type II/IV secretion system ATPase subunit, partial [Halobacteriota archaeon]